uniref:Uncharacterized protein n=1 Tax=Cacopsylla melanoneura TaxID=428564 RepID=A0A8D9ALC1_9HEMI
MLDPRHPREQDFIDMYSWSTSSLINLTLRNLKNRTGRAPRPSFTYISDRTGRGKASPLRNSPINTTYRNLWLEIFTRLKTIDHLPTKVNFILPGEFFLGLSF